jgi:chromosome segregation protein
VTALESRLGTLEIEQAETRSRRTELDTHHNTCQREYESRQTRVDEAKRGFEAIEANVAKALDKRDRLLAQQDEAVKLVSAAREQRSAHQARIAVLEELERRQEGVGLGVREILQRARSSDHSPWNLIQGSVSDLLEVDLERAPLVDVALGESAQWIVIDKLKPLGDYLLEHTGRLTDRVGFLAADSAPKHESEIHDLAGQHPDVVERLSARYAAWEAEMIPPRWGSSAVDPKPGR